MPAGFLTHQQKEKYGKFCEELTSDQLAKYFLLDDQDKLLVFRRKGEHNHLGFALQLGTVRFLGAFLTNPIDVPSNVIHYLSSQLNISDSVLALYQASKTHWSHKLEIKETYGYHDFTEQPYHLRLIRWLYNHFWLSSEHPGVLFNLAMDRCIGQKILLPGATVLERLISQIRERATSRLWHKLASLPDTNQREILENLLMVDDKNKTGLESLRQPVTHESPIGFLKAIERFKMIYSIGAYQWNISRIPIGKIGVLSRYASMARAQIIESIEEKPGCCLQEYKQKLEQ